MNKKLPAVDLEYRSPPHLPEPPPADLSGAVPITPGCLAKPLQGNPLGADPVKPGSPA